ncbi:hypothetical protein D3C72_544650 [compost metagenome]
MRAQVDGVMLIVRFADIGIDEPLVLGGFNNLSCFERGVFILLHQLADWLVNDRSTILYVFHHIIQLMIYSCAGIRYADEDDPQCGYP